MNDISFQSRIRLTSMDNFTREVRIRKNNYVNYPWTIRESVLAPEAGTKNIFDCTAAAITDGLNVLMLHICPTNPKNNNLNNIERFIENKIDLKNPYLQGFIIGSKNDNIQSPNSPKLFDFFENLMNKYKILYSSFRGGNYAHNAAYLCKNDEFIIGTNILNDTEPQKVFKNANKACESIFDEFKISEFDELTW